MIGYRICQIRLMVPGDGVHPGLESVLYHSIQVMLLKPQIDKVPAELVIVLILLLFRWQFYEGIVYPEN